MKIGILIDQLVLGGVQKTALMEAKTLQKKGHQVTVLVLMRHNYTNQYADLTKNLKVRFLSDDYPYPLRRSFKFPIFSFLSTLHLLSPTLAPRVIRPKQFDLIISHGTTTCFTAQSLWQKLGIPYIAVVYDPMIYIFDKVYSKTPLRFLFPILAIITIAKERAFILNSLYTAVDSPVHQDYLKGVYNVIPEVIPLGCQPLKNPPKKLGTSILALSRWEKSKNPQLLLKLLQKIKGAHLIMAGSWLNQEDKENFRKAVTQRKLTKRVEIIDHFEEKDLKNLCQRSRLWLHPHFEAFGMGGLEAAARGLPLIMPRGSGLTSFFQDKIHGFFPKKATLKTYFPLVKKLLEKTKLAQKMGRIAWQRAKKELTWESHTNKMLNLARNALVARRFNLTVLENGHLSEEAVAGGDRVFREMLGDLPKDYKISVVLPRIGLRHWQKAKEKVSFKVLTPPPFAGRQNPLTIFMIYILRIFQSYQYLINKPDLSLLYSSTNVFADVVPAFLVRRQKRQARWIARVFHILPSPFKRQGNLLVNIGAYFFDRLSLFLIKQKADLILVLNQSLYQALLAQGFPREKTKVLGAGINLAEIDAIPIPRKKKYDGVFLGRLHPSKGIFDAIKIWEMVKKQKPKAKLAIIGEGKGEVLKKVKQEIKKRDLEKSIKLLGYLPRKRVFKTLKESRLFLFLDYEAGWGMAVAEAMACGLPVVGYDLEIFGSVFKKGFRTVPLGKTRLFTQEVITLLEKSRARKKLAQEAHNQAQELDWKKTSSQFIKIIKTVWRKTQ